MSQISYGTITIIDTNDIESITIEYAKNSSNSVPPGSQSADWSTTRPTWEQGKYIWQRTRIHKSGTSAIDDTFGDAVCLSGSSGANGRSLISTETRYTNTIAGASQSYVIDTTTEAGWLENVPEYDEYKPDYWVRIKNTFNSAPLTEYIYYKDNGTTDAMATAAAANSTAEEALDQSGEALTNSQNAINSVSGLQQNLTSYISSNNLNVQALQSRTKYMWTNASNRTNDSIYDGQRWTYPDYPVGSYMASGIENIEFNEENSNTYGFNSFLQHNALNLRYNAVKYTELSTANLIFYYPKINDVTPIQGESALKIDANGINLYSKGSGTEEARLAATLTTSGLTIKNGSVVLGTLSGVANGNVALSNTDFTRSINGQSRTNLRMAIGSNFGVKNDGTLYAENAIISGHITVADGETVKPLSDVISINGWSTKLRVTAVSYVDNTATVVADLYYMGATPTNTQLNSVSITYTWKKTVTSGTTTVVGSNSNTLSVTSSMGLNASYTCVVTIVKNGVTNTPSATIDFNSLNTAGVANKYITRIDSSGIKVHAENNVNLNYAKINASGFEVFKTDGASTPSAKSVAFFGENTRIGATDVDGRVMINSTGDYPGFWIVNPGWTGSYVCINSNSARFGLGTKTYLTINNSTGAAGIYTYLPSDTSGATGTLPRTQARLTFASDGIRLYNLNDGKLKSFFGSYVQLGASADYSHSIMNERGLTINTKTTEETNSYQTMYVGVDSNDNYNPFIRIGRMATEGHMTLNTTSGLRIWNSGETASYVQLTSDNFRIGPVLANKARMVITASSINLYQRNSSNNGDNSIATFGATTIIGKSNGQNVTITSSEFSLNYNTTKYISITNNGALIGNWKITGGGLEAGGQTSGGVYYRCGIQPTTAGLDTGASAFYAGCTSQPGNTVADPTITNFFVTHAGKLYCTDVQFGTNTYGYIILGQFTSDSNVKKSTWRPGDNSVADLGSANHRWDYIYVNNVQANSFGPITSTGKITAGSNFVLPVGTSIGTYPTSGKWMPLIFGNANANIYIGSTTSDSSNVATGTIFMRANTAPVSNGDYSLGTSSYKWSTVYATTFSGNATTATTATNVSGGSVSCTSITTSSNITLPNNTSIRAKNSSGSIYALLYASSANNIQLGTEDWADCYIHRVYTASSGTVTDAVNVRITSAHRLARYASSSERYKEDIELIQDNNLKPELLYELPIKQFKYHSSYIEKYDSRADYTMPGFIVEDVEKIYSIAVDYDDDGNPEDWNVRYIVPPMLALVQEQHKDIEQLKEEIQNLKSEIQELKQLIK